MFNSQRVSVLQDEKVLGLYGTAVFIAVTLICCTLKNGDIFSCYIFFHSASRGWRRVKETWY